MLAALARAPFVGAGMSPDEGGYAYVAREWARGARLYADVWIDRPQGLISVYRSVIAVADHPWGFRLTALLVGVCVTLLVGAIGWLLRGPATGVAAAAIYAIVGAGPPVEGFTLNGELAASLPAAAAVAAILVRWRRGGRRWLAVAGVLGGSAMLMKQGGFDGLLAAAALVCAVGPSWRERARSVGTIAAGAAVPLAVAAIHALSVGFGSYWDDVVAFRASSEFHDGSRSYFFNASWHNAQHDVLALAVVAAIGLAAVAWKRTERVVVCTWLAAALVAFNVGGLFWAHYYVQLLPPLALLAGIGATAFRSRAIAVVLVCAAVAPVAVMMAGIAAKADGYRVRYEKTYWLDRQVAAFLRAHSSPRDSIYALDSRADLYYLADRGTRYPYIWHHSPVLTPNGRARLRRYLAGPERPRFVVVYRNPAHFDRSGALARVVERGYALVWKPKYGIRVLVRRGRAPGGGGRPARPLIPLDRLGSS